MIIESKELVQNPMVSVVICTYNQEKTIAQTIENILFQRCEYQFEMIIGDDCSTDLTRDVCLKYQKLYSNQIKLILFEQNNGVVNNWISCIKESRGKYLTTCGGDDFWNNLDKLQIQVDYMEINPQCGVLHTDFDELDVSTNKITKSYRLNQNEVVLQGYRQQEIFNGKLKIVAPTACIRKELFDKYIPIDKYLELEFPIEDWPTWIIISKYSEINYLPVSTVTYRKGHESLSNLKTYKKLTNKFFKERIMYEFLCNLFPEDIAFDKNKYDSYVNSVLLNLAFKLKEYPKANEFGKEIGQKSLKVICSQNRILFWIFVFLKRIKNR